MKHLLLPLALLCSLAFTSCADRLRPTPQPLGRYRYDPPDGPGNGYYGPSNYAGYNDPGYGYPHFRTPAHSAPLLSDGKHSANYRGGPREWYEQGVALGRRDRDSKWSPLHARHRESYDHVTEADFARGYNDGYSGRAL